MYRNFFLCLFATFAFGITAAENSPTATLAQEVSSETFTNSKRGYSFQFPSNWTKDEFVIGFDIFIKAPNNAEGRSLANVSIISGDLPQEVNLDIYFKENLNNLLKDNPEIQIKESGKTTVAGLPTNWVRYVRKDNQTEIVHYFFVAKGVGFLITCGSAEGVFDQYQPTFEKIVQSFKML